MFGFGLRMTETIRRVTVDFNAPSRRLLDGSLDRQIPLLHRASSRERATAGRYRRGGGCRFGSSGLTHSN